MGRPNQCNPCCGDSDPPPPCSEVSNCDALICVALIDENSHGAKGDDTARKRFEKRYDLFSKAYPNRLLIVLDLPKFGNAEMVYPQNFLDSNSALSLRIEHARNPAGLISRLLKDNGDASIANFNDPWARIEVMVNRYPEALAKFNAATDVAVFVDRSGSTRPSDVSATVDKLVSDIKLSGRSHACSTDHHPNTPSAFLEDVICPFIYNECCDDENAAKLITECNSTLPPGARDRIISCCPDGITTVVSPTSQILIRDYCKEGLNEDIFEDEEGSVYKGVCLTCLGGIDTQQNLIFKFDLTKDGGAVVEGELDYVVEYKDPQDESFKVLPVVLGAGFSGNAFVRSLLIDQWGGNNLTEEPHHSWLLLDVPVFDQFEETLVGSKGCRIRTWDRKFRVRATFSDTSCPAGEIVGYTEEFQLKEWRGPISSADGWIQAGGMEDCVCPSLHQRFGPKPLHFPDLYNFQTGAMLTSHEFGSTTVGMMSALFEADGDFEGPPNRQYSFRSWAIPNDLSQGNAGCFVEQPDDLDNCDHRIIPFRDHLDEDHNWSARAAQSMPLSRSVHLKRASSQYGGLYSCDWADGSTIVWIADASRYNSETGLANYSSAAGGQITRRLITATKPDPANDGERVSAWTETPIMRKNTVVVEKQFGDPDTVESLEMQFQCIYPIKGTSHTNVTGNSFSTVTIAGGERCITLLKSINTVTLPSIVFHRNLDIAGGARIPFFGIVGAFTNSVVPGAVPTCLTVLPVADVTEHPRTKRYMAVHSAEFEKPAGGPVLPGFVNSSLVGPFYFPYEFQLKRCSSVSYNGDRSEFKELFWISGGGIAPVCYAYNIQEGNPNAEPRTVWRANLTPTDTPNGAFPSEFSCLYSERGTAFFSQVWSHDTETARNFYIKVFKVKPVTGNVEPLVTEYPALIRSVEKSPDYQLTTAQGTEIDILLWKSENWIAIKPRFIFQDGSEGIPGESIEFWFHPLII